MKYFLNILCCTNTDDKDDIQEIPKEKPKEQERNLLNMYGNTMDGNYLLARITQKNFFVDILQRKKKKDTIECPQSIYYSLYEKGARYENSEQLIPEKVLQYIGRRASEVSPKLIVDALSRSGQSTIQLCLESNCLVLGFNPNINGILNAQWNARIYNANLTDNIQAQIPNLPFKKCDIFFINPDFDVPYDEPFQINTMLRPNIKEIMMSGLTKSKNMIIMLPQFISLHEVCQQIAFYQNKFQKDHFKIEIQQIQVDGILTNYVFYLGEIAALAQQNELLLMTELCIEDTTADIHNQVYELLKKLSKNMKPKSILDMILYCQQQAQQDSETTYMSFLHRLLSQKLISQFEYNQLQVIEQTQTPYIDVILQNQTFGYANNVVNYQYSLILINPAEEPVSNIYRLRNRPKRMEMNYLLIIKNELSALKKIFFLQRVNHQNIIDINSSLRTAKNTEYHLLDLYQKKIMNYPLQRKLRKLKRKVLEKTLAVSYSDFIIQSLKIYEQVRNYLLWRIQFKYFLYLQNHALNVISDITYYSSQHFLNSTHSFSIIFIDLQIYLRLGRLSGKQLGGEQLRIKSLKH